MKSEWFNRTTEAKNTEEIVFTWCDHSAQHLSNWTAALHNTTPIRLLLNGAQNGQNRKVFSLFLADNDKRVKNSRPSGDNLFSSIETHFFASNFFYFTLTDEDRARGKMLVKNTIRSSRYEQQKKPIDRNNTKKKTQNFQQKYENTENKSVFFWD